MMKNVVDVVLGGVSYWAIGYGLSYGSDTVSIFIITNILIFEKNCFTFLVSQDAIEVMFVIERVTE